MQLYPKINDVLVPVHREDESVEALTVVCEEGPGFAVHAGARPQHLQVGTVHISLYRREQLASAFFWSVSSFQIWIRYNLAFQIRIQILS